MAKVKVTKSYLKDIADAIRAKLGVNNTYAPGQMASAVDRIHGEPVLQYKNAVQNGTVLPDTGYDGLSQVIVAVPQNEPILESLTVLENGIYIPSENVDGFSSVKVNVSGSGSLELATTRCSELIDYAYAICTTGYSDFNVLVAASLVE